MRASGSSGRAAAAQVAPSPSAVQAISLLGDTLRAPALAPATRERFEAQLAEARALVAPFSDTLRLIENENYLRLLLLYNGTLTPDALLAPVAGGATSADVSVAYGVSAWYRAEGRPVEADRVLRAIVAGSQWPAFGYLAAEADIARLR